MGLRDDLIEAGSRAAAQERGLDVEQWQDLCFQMEAALDAMLELLSDRREEWASLYGLHFEEGRIAALAGQLVAVLWDEPNHTGIRYK